MIVLLGGLLLASLSGVTWYVVRRTRKAGKHTPKPQPIGPPIEEIARGLQRLLLRHDRIARSDDAVLRVRRASELESAITWRATQAARALGVRAPVPPVDKPELRLLLQTLATEGLVLPPAVELMTPTKE